MEVYTKEIYDLLIKRKAVGNENYLLVQPFINSKIENIISNLPTSLESIGFKVLEIGKKEVTALKRNLKFNIEHVDESSLIIKIYKNDELWLVKCATLQDINETYSSSRYYLTDDKIYLTGSGLPNDDEEIIKINNDIEVFTNINKNIRTTNTVHLVFNVSDRLGWIGDIKDVSFEDLIIDLFNSFD